MSATKYAALEPLARALCKRKGINPDAQCHAMRPETEERLGKTYPAWAYQAADLEWVFSQLERGKFRVPGQ